MLCEFDSRISPPTNPTLPRVPLARRKMSCKFVKWVPTSRKPENLVFSSWSGCISGSSSSPMLKAAGSRACAPPPQHHTHMAHAAGHRAFCGTAPDTPLCQALFRTGSCICERGHSSDGKASWKPSRSSIDGAIGPNNSISLTSLETTINTHSVWVHESDDLQLVLQAQGLYLCWGWWSCLHAVLQWHSHHVIPTEITFVFQLLLQKSCLP